jgi:taurine---2-oxoglutarate transaminase
MFLLKYIRNKLYPDATYTPAQTVSTTCIATSSSVYPDATYTPAQTVSTTCIATSSSVSHEPSNTLIPWAVQNTFKSHHITHAGGCYLYNNDKKIMDFTSGLMVVNLGHNNQRIKDGFKQHLDTGVAYTSSLFEHGQREKLSTRLVTLTGNPGGKVFYTNGGGDSNETAVFIAHSYQKFHNNSQRIRILSFEKSFHGGSTIGATLLTGDDRKSSKEAFYSLPFESIMPNPDLSDAGAESIIQIQSLLKNDDVAAIIIEGSSGSASCIPYPDGYLQQLEILCKENNIILICDEVMSGWGRTGYLFAYEKHNIKPDIITTAKAFTSGYVPFGGVIMTRDIASIYDNEMFVHGLTYFAHPLACTIANVCIDIYLNNDMEIIKKVHMKGILLNKLGNKLEKDSSIVANYMNNGLLGRIELNITDPDVLTRIINDLFDNGIFCFRRKNLVFTAPPLVISNNELMDSMQIIHDVLCKDVYKEYTSK